MKKATFLTFICSCLMVGLAYGDVPLQVFTINGQPVSPAVASAYGNLTNPINQFLVHAHVNPDIGIRLEANKIDWKINLYGDYMTSIRYKVMSPVPEIFVEVKGAEDLQNVSGGPTQALETYYCLTHEDPAHGRGIPTESEFIRAQEFNGARPISPYGALWNRLRVKSDDPLRPLAGEYMDEFTLTFCAGL